MKITASGDYKLPGPFNRLVGNLSLSVAKLVPQRMQREFLSNHKGYQVFDETEVGDNEGISIRKWEAMRMPADLKGKSVLDIGCAEGFFCRQSARSGAGPVLGVDTSLGRLMRASFISLQERLTISYRMGVFPNFSLRRQYSYIICLSVLHHSLKKKDLWKVLTQPECKGDLIILRQQLRFLRSLTADGGKCILEMPYEYDDPAERTSVDFDLFNRELTSAGFARAQCLGSWDYNPKYKEIKDRLIYVAEA